MEFPQPLWATVPVFDQPHCEFLSNCNSSCCDLHLLLLVCSVVSPGKAWPLGRWEQQFRLFLSFLHGEQIQLSASFCLLCTPDPSWSWWSLSVSCTGEPKTRHRILDTALLMPSTGNNHFPWPISVLLLMQPVWDQPKRTLLTHVHLVWLTSPLRVFFQKTAFYPFSPQPDAEGYSVPGVGLRICHCYSFVSPFLQSAEVPLKGSSALWCVSCSLHPYDVGNVRQADHAHLFAMLLLVRGGRLLTDVSDRTEYKWGLEIRFFFSLRQEKTVWQTPLGYIIQIYLSVNSKIVHKQKKTKCKLFYSYLRPVLKTGNNRSDIYFSSYV